MAVDEGPHLFVRLLGRRERARHIVEQTRPLLVLGFQFQNDRDRFMVVLVFLVRTLKAVVFLGLGVLAVRLQTDEDHLQVPTTITFLHFF